MWHQSHAHIRYGAECDLNDHTHWWFTDLHFAGLICLPQYDSIITMLVYLKVKGAHDPEEYYKKKRSKGGGLGTNQMICAGGLFFCFFFNCSTKVMKR